MIEKKKHVHIAQNSGNHERYTPGYIIELARETMGDIDIDPASCEVANTYLVKATQYFDKHSDGLIQEWNGRVWLNPPYDRGLIDLFVDKLFHEYSIGHTTQAIVLTNNATETRWCNRLVKQSDAVCLVFGRIHFCAPNSIGQVYTPKGSPLQGQLITYIGDDWKRFCDKFKTLGICLRPVSS